MIFNLWQGYTPHPAQARFHREAKRFAAVGAGVRGGKSTAGAREMLRRMYTDRAAKGGHLHYWLVSPTYPTGKVQRRMFLHCIGGPKSPLLIVERKTDREFILHGDITVEYRSASDSAALIAEGLDGIWIDEPARISEEAWFELQGRLASNNGWAIATGTPEGENWFYDRFVRPAWDKEFNGYDPVNYSCHVWHTIDNRFIKNVEAEVARVQNTMPPEYFSRYYQADFHSFRGKIYKEFRRETHVINAIPAGASLLETRYGVDWGTRDPFVLLILQRWKLDGREFWVIVEEHISEGMVEAEMFGLAQRVKTEYGNHRFYCDPSALSHKKAFRRAGLLVTDGINDVLLGIESVSMAMHVVGGHPGLLMLDRCPKTIRAALNYRWKETEREVPDHDYSDPMDALRYALHSRAHKPGRWGN